MINRPKKENFTRRVFDGDFDAMYVFDNESYEKALNDYIDQLENALDKACNDWEEETKDCYYLMIKNNLCDCRCGLCKKEKKN